MFSVLCINDTDSIMFGFDGESPKVGNEYLVEHEVVGYNKILVPILCYKIHGFDELVYERKNFIRISEIDETEYIRQTLTENA